VFCADVVQTTMQQVAKASMKIRRIECTSSKTWAM
jgi:hypothetical protein